MSKSSKILYSVLGGVVLLVILNVIFAGSGHVEVVKTNVNLNESNQKLTKENEKLTTENKELKVMADSLIVAGDSLKSEMSTLENQVTDYENKTKEVDAPNRDDAFSRPYTISIPITEISDSTN